MKVNTAEEQAQLDALEARDAVDIGEDARVETVARAMRITRECQAGMAFGVPPDARDQFMRALAVAALAAMHPADETLRRVEALAAQLDEDQERAYQRSANGYLVDEFSDGQRHAYEDAADRIRAAVAPLASPTTEKASKA